jgi:hypothetical protein
MFYNNNRGKWMKATVKKAKKREMPIRIGL